MALALIGIALAVAALILPLVIERKRRPQLRIDAAKWSAAVPVPWEFAAIGVSNVPLSGTWSWLLTRQSAEGCTLNFTITRSDETEPCIPDLPGRWSGAPEPYRTDPQPDPKGGWTTIDIFDHSLVPDSFRFDIASNGIAEEVAVAVLRDGDTYAFNSWSYGYPKWRKPEWKLELGDYVVVARATASGARAEATFSLNVSKSGLHLQLSQPTSRRRFRRLGAAHR